jgi:hypothetical protein
LNLKCHLLIFKFCFFKIVNLYRYVVGLISRRSLASPTQVIAMQALLNISSLRSAMPEIGKHCLERLMVGLCTS